MDIASQEMICLVPSSIYSHVTSHAQNSSKPTRPLDAQEYTVQPWKENLNPTSQYQSARGRTIDPDKDNQDVSHEDLLFYCIVRIIEYAQG